MKAGLFLACAAMAISVPLSQPAQAAAAKSAGASAAKSHDWSLVVGPTPAGGFVMGNPKAKVKLIEYGSMTCPHCAHFDEDAVPSLIGDYVKTGKVSWEFRNYVRDAVDVSASLLTRCGGARRFFPLTRALFADQRSWEKRIAQASQDELTRVQALPPEQQFLAAAKLAGLPQWAAAHGIPATKSSQCLKDGKAIGQLVQMASDAKTEFPDFAGTPSFVVNGTMVEFGAITAAEVWPTLESRIKAALGDRCASAAAQPDPSLKGAEN